MERVLILCTANSCRSQMAEGLLRHMAGDRYEVHSAGTLASCVNARAIQVMAEAGIDISTHESESLDRYVGQDFDLVVTVCDYAHRSCPAFPGARRQVHWPFADPAAASGGEEDILNSFRRIRDQIRDRFKKELVD